MLDVQNAPALPPTIKREDYRAPDWLVPEIALDFELSAERTIVKARLSVERSGDHATSLVLNGEELELIAVRVDGSEADFSHDGNNLVIPLSGHRHEIETEVAIAPGANTKLMGLYASSGMLCSQCEAEGFRPARHIVPLFGADERR
jgi:aminopeptidase N